MTYTATDHQGAPKSIFMYTHRQMQTVLYLQNTKKTLNKTTNKMIHKWKKGNDGS